MTSPNNSCKAKTGPRAVKTLRPKPKPGVAPVKRLVARPEQKRPHSKETVPTKKPPAPVARDATVAAQPEDAGDAAAAPAAPAARRSLDALTAQALHDELQRVMIEVWQTLPDDPPCSVEKMVVDKFRNEAGDMFRNVLGLNVTKRLLNTFNPLNVKVHFSTKPERKYLRQFLKQYNFVAFKRIARVGNTFAAQVKTIADYDRICSHTDIHCGAAKITITPYYRFKQCPKNIDTIYTCTPDEDLDPDRKEDTEEYDDSDVTNSNDTAGKLAAAINKQEDNIAQQKTDTTETKTLATNTIDNEDTNKENDNAKAGTEIKNVPKPQVETSTEPTKTQAESTNAATTIEPKTAQAPQPEKKSALANPAAATVSLPTQLEKKDTPDKPQSKFSPPKPSLANEADANSKPEPPKPKAVAKTVVASKTKNVVKPLANKNTAKKVIYSKPVKGNLNKQKNFKKSFEEKDDFEELDDEDILALMSGGIVLDECCGSDEE